MTSTTKQDVLDKLYEELKAAADREQNDALLPDPKWGYLATGFVNGILTAIDIVKTIEEE